LNNGPKGLRFKYSQTSLCSNNLFDQVAITVMVQMLRIFGEKMNTNGSRLIKAV